MSPASAPRCIGDLIEVPPVRTVIRLKEGRESPEEIAGSFVFTAEVSAHLNVISEALRAGKGQGYFLQGDFGSGKSHFLAAVYAWLRAGAGAGRLSEAHPGLRQTAEAGRRVLPVAVSLIDYRSGTPLERILLESIEKALAEGGRAVSLTPLAAFLSRLKELLLDGETAALFAALAGEAAGEEEVESGSAEGTPGQAGATEAAGAAAAPGTPDELAGWISRHPRRAYTAGVRLLKKLGMQTPQALVEERRESFQRVYQELGAAGFDGLFLLIDELSEFFRSKPTSQSLNEDARALQFLGELTAERPLWIVAAVQESIEATGDIAQSTFRKIKDRFPVKLPLSTVHIRSLISERLVVKKPGAQEEIYRIFEHYRNQFPGFSCSFDEFRQLYPVHPVTIFLLDGLGELFSQHRGIVDFVHSRIAGDSRRGIPSILERPPRELLGPDSIYEHFAARLAEFSAFNIYPRHIVPHLDREIDLLFDNGEDRHLARRLVRMLVLYRIHPTADTPGAARLAELASLDLPEMSARFVAEAILDPLAASSRFLRRRTAGPGTGPGQPGWDPAQAVYEISAEEDTAKILEARIRRVREEIPADDSRLLLEPLSRLAESDSWPGPAVAREGAVREITWNLSQRRALVKLQHPEDPAGLGAQLEARDCDFALLLAPQSFPAPGPQVAVWSIPFPRDRDGLDTLAEHLALRLLQEGLSPSNPADAPLVPLAAERYARLKPAAAQAALEALYSGGFSDPGIRVDAAVRQLRRFDSLLEAAGQFALAARYPRFVEVSPRRYTPSARIYQQLLESFVIPGTLSLSEARPLAAAIDGLAVPLGLVELKRGSYVFSPDIAGHPLLAFFFELLRPSGSVALKEVLGRLTRGDFGLPKDTALFLIASLAAGGLISARKAGRTLALEYLSLQNLERAEEIALGELIGEHDRATLLEECGFLSATGEIGSFGLRQQRDLWKEVVAFRGTAERLAADTLARLAQRREYSSFKGFRFTSLEEKLQALGRLAGEIRVSYPAKEGLEKFLAAWRSSGLDAGAIPLLKGLDRFLKREAEKFVFIHHYLRHEAAQKAAGLEPELEPLRQRILELLENPEELVLPDEGAELDRLFGAFRERYLPLYAEWHARHYESRRRPPLSRNASRALAVLQRLAASEALDRPPGLDRFLAGLAAAEAGQCSRQVREELMRSPVCGCGFLPGQAVEGPGREAEVEIDRYLGEYVGILKAPRVLEALAGHAYAVQDLRPAAAAHLQELAAGLRSGSLSASGLVGALDEASAAELAAALSGKVSLRRVSLAALVQRLAGRRLPAERVLALVSEWLGKGREGELVAVEGAAGAAGTAGPEAAQAAGGQDPLDWWPLMSAGALPDPSLPAEALSRKIRELEARLEERFPAAGLAASLRRLGPEALLHYICAEPFHIRAVQAAWRILAERALKGKGAPEGTVSGPTAEAGRRQGSRSRHADPARAAEIEGHLELAARIARSLARGFPERLSVRLDLEALLSDPWTDADLQAAASTALAEVAALGERWLGGLPPVQSLDLGRAPLVLLVDAMAPDLWLAVQDLIEAYPQELATSWARLEAEPKTVPATSALLGLEAEPVESLEARGILYLQRSGRETERLADWLEALPAGRAAVIRLGGLDRDAHEGSLKLAEMAAMLRHLLERHLPDLLRFCRQQGRPLVLTTDHGLSLASGHLRHGRGGVYERAIFRASWGL